MDPTKVALIVNSSSYERVSYALSIATISAAHLKDVHVLFTYGAVRRLVKGKTDDVGEETDAWTSRVRKRLYPKNHRDDHVSKRIWGKNLCLFGCINISSSHARRSDRGD